MKKVHLKTCHGVESYLWIAGALAPVEVIPEFLSHANLKQAFRFLESQRTLIQEIADAEFVSLHATPE